MRIRPATPKALEEAARRIRRGLLVAFPTETVYGLGANALDPAAVLRIFEAKGRPADNPLIVHVSDLRMLARVATGIPRVAKRLMDAFWPGPLTLVLPRHPEVPEVVTAGLSRVAVRMPAGAIARQLIRLAGVPIAAPSANVSGRPSPTTAAHVAEDFANLRGLLLIDGGSTELGLESTVVSFDGDTVRVLREGAISREALAKVVGLAKEEGDRADRHGERPESPGLKYRHYAPTRPLFVFRAGREASLLAFVEAHSTALVLCRDGAFPELPKERVVTLGRSLKEMGRRLFDALRTQRPGESLIVLGVRKTGTGRAIMDRLERAATQIF